VLALRVYNFSIARIGSSVQLQYYITNTGEHTILVLDATGTDELSTVSESSASVFEVFGYQFLLCLYSFILGWRVFFVTPAS
jgi:hypothetical protein